MIVPIPEAGEDTWFTFRINYDNRVLTCTLYWCEETQAIYDTLQRQLRNDAQNDPIYDGTNYIRDYDIMEYYSAANPINSVEAYEAWYDEHKDRLTVGLSKLIDVDLRKNVMARSLLYYNIRKTLTDTGEMNAWTFTITDEGEAITGTLRPGALYERNNAWSVWVRSDTREVIGRNDLAFAYLEFV